MPEEDNPYASPAPIPHDAVPKRVDPLEPLLGPSLGLLLGSAIEILIGISLVPEFVHDMRRPDRDMTGLLFVPMFLAGVPIFIGAWNMRNGTRYRLAYAAAVLASIPMLTLGVWCGTPLGIWALVVLHRRDVKEAFALKEREKSANANNL